jgi:Leucine-rich repeat (LRR) protein
VKDKIYPDLVEIKCGGNENIDLKHIFNELSINLEERQKSFSTFYLNNTAISELPENVFEDITFGQIAISDAYSLLRIHMHAFTATNNYLTNFWISNTPLKNSLPYYDLFTSISLMPHLTGLSIINTSITEIPDNAFRPLSGIQYNLFNVYIENNKLKRIGNNAFQYWPSLYHMSLSNNTLNYISENVFNFRKLSHVPILSPLRLSWYNNNFNSSSFEIGAFTKFNKPTLMLFIGPNDKNNITYLEKHVFEPFLRDSRFGIQSNRIEMLSTLDCNDCRNYWLLQNEDYKYKIMTLMCSNHKMLNDSSHFKLCKS